MDKLQGWYTHTLWLDLSSNQDLQVLVQTSVNDLTLDQMIDLILWIDSCYEYHSLTNWFQDHPHEFFEYHEKLWKSPYQLLQDDPLWWINILASLYNLNFMVFDD